MIASGVLMGDMMLAFWPPKMGIQSGQVMSRADLSELVVANWKIENSGAASDALESTPSFIWIWTGHT